MLLQRTLWPLNRNFFELLHASLKIELKVVPQRILGNIHQSCNLPMR